MPPTFASSIARALCLASLIALTGCDSAEPVVEGQGSTAAPLPGPQQAGGAITDMPAAPGPGEVPLAGSAPPPPPPEQAAVDGVAGLPPLEDNPEAGLPATPPPAGAPDPQAAPAAAVEDPRDVLRRYYAAVNARDFTSAQAAWVEGADASGTLAQDFADATSVELTVGEPRPAEGAAGSVYVEVPVTVTTRRADGSRQHQAGRYTLRRSQVDGASAAQRNWRIAGIDLRDAAR